MKTLLSGYDKTTQELMFRVYVQPIPAADRRTRNKASHFYADDLLGAALAEDFQISHAKISRTGLEKPVLLHENLHMNLSHCKDLAVAAVGKVPLGVDAEPPREIKEKLMRTVCTPAETAWITSQPETDRLFAFSRIWTLKEAYTKYTGEGIRRPFSSLEFLIGNGLEFRHPASGKVCFFQMIHGNQHVISLCVPHGAHGEHGAHGDYDISQAAEDWELLCETSEMGSRTDNLTEKENAYADD